MGGHIEGDLQTSPQRRQPQEGVRPQANTMTSIIIHSATETHNSYNVIE